LCQIGIVTVHPSGRVSQTNDRMRFTQL
jgi:hypothetical protein